ncbi:MAG: hypothetical protein ACAH17_03105 [Candidatus Paceibacterota bacterium]
MFSVLKDSTVWVFFALVSFCQAIWFGGIALTEWLQGFAFVDEWLLTFLLPKIAVVLLGLWVTSIPLWALLLISFLPIGIVAPLFFIAFIVMLAH